MFALKSQKPKQLASRGVSDTLYGSAKIQAFFGIPVSTPF
jgi:hypothetical protein